MKTLHLNLTRIWFDMILSGEKTEEYREIKPHWCSQLLLINNESAKESYDLIFLSELLKRNSEIQGIMSYKLFDTITFSNGYAKNRPKFEIELKKIEIKEGNPEWGAEPGKKYFVLELGGVLTDKNI